MTEEEAKLIKEKRIQLTFEEMSDILNLNVDTTKCLCYQAALTLKEDHSITPWTR